MVVNDDTLSHFHKLDQELRISFTLFGCGEQNGR